MNWKRFIIVCVNLAALLFPYNIIGCADSGDPYDYYVSFFHKDVSGTKGYEPFYYTNYLFLYGSEEPENTSKLTSAEWSAWSANNFNTDDAYDFMCRFAHKHISSLYYHIEKNQVLKVPDSVKNNGMTRYFLQKRDLEALGYILYAKQCEPFVTGQWNDWELTQRDSVKMSGLIKNGQQLYKAAKSDYVKLRYAYQVARLALYNNRSAECLEWYDAMIKNNPSKSVLHELSDGLKAGALFRLGRKNQAAVEFSQLFARSKVKRVANYISFDWCVDRFNTEERTKALQYCKTDVEKANMMGLLALGSNQIEISTLETLQRIAPNAPILPILITREINKVEEFVLAPSLEFNQGKEKVFIGDTEFVPTGKEYKSWTDESRRLIGFCRTAAKASTTPGVFLLAGAHSALIAGDYMNSRTLLDQAKNSNLSGLQRDQWAMTNLLLAINTRKTIDADFEKELMASVPWLEKKAATDVEFAKFARRLFANVLAPKYKMAKDKNSYKYVFCLGVADAINNEHLRENWGYGSRAHIELQNHYNSAQAADVVRLMENKNASTFEKWLCSKALFTIDDALDAAGTTWLRQYNFTEAEKWFKRVKPGYYRAEPYKSYLAANPFADLLLDIHTPTKQDTVVYTKLSFAQKMLRLEKELATQVDKEKKARTHYELAKGYYHMSYFGNSWMLVHCGWTTSDMDSEGEWRASVYNPDYYELKTALSHYKNALQNSSDKNFQARCLYMAAKCEQKSTALSPPFWWRPSDENKTEYREWLQKFDKATSYYTQLKKNYSNTAFYKEAFNTCIYLQDFVKQK